MAATIIYLLISLLVSLVFIILGIRQYRAEKPVVINTGEKPPRAEELYDVNAWNKKHGFMWVIYGIVIIASYGAGAMMGDTIWSAIPMCGGVIIPLPFMIMYHHKLIKIYKKYKTES